MDALRTHFGNDQYAVGLSGVSLIDAAPGRAVATMRLEPRHHNSIGMTHGGALFTLADYAFAVASNASGRVAVGIETSMSFHKATREGILTAEAVEVSRSYRISHVDVRITEEGGDLVAQFHGVACRKSDTIPGLQPEDD